MFVSMYYVGQLCFLVLKVVVLCRRRPVEPRSTIYSGYQNQVLCCVMLPESTPVLAVHTSCSDWAATAVGTLVDGAGLSLAHLEARVQLLWVSSGWSQHPMWLAKRPGCHCYVYAHEQSCPPTLPRIHFGGVLILTEDAYQVRQGGSCLPCHDKRRPQGKQC